MIVGPRSDLLAAEREPQRHSSTVPRRRLWTEEG